VHPKKLTHNSEYTSTVDTLQEQRFLRNDPGQGGDDYFMEYISPSPPRAPLKNSHITLNIQAETLQEQKFLRNNQAKITHSKFRVK
jgi:hypothetical protein